MPVFAFFTAVETDKSKDDQVCTVTSRGRRPQPSRKRLENDITEEATTRIKILGKAAKARALKRKDTNGPGWPDLDSEG